MISLPATLRRLLLVAFLFFTAMSEARAFTIQQIDSPSGIGAWLVEDYTVPIVSMAVSIKGGATQDPSRKEGMATLLASLLDEGAGPYDSQAFQTRIEEIGMDLAFRAGRDSVDISMRVLRDDLQTGLELLRLALAKPRFDAAAIERMRNALKARIARSRTSPQARASRRLREALFGNHPYSRPVQGTIEGLDAISREDVVAHFSRLVTRERLTLGIVGAISANEAAEMIDTVFAALPETSDLPPVPPANPVFGERIEIDDDIPQAVIALALPGVSRKDPDFFAAYLVNHILGGGFTSRLYDEVREKRGLAYSISSDLVQGEHAAWLSLRSATRPDRAELALTIIAGELERMAREGPTEAELEAAKSYVIGAYAINNLDSSRKVAAALVDMQIYNLGTDYLQRREALIASVTVQQARDVARRLLGQSPTIVTVGAGK